MADSDVTARASPRSPLQGLLEARTPILNALSEGVIVADAGGCLMFMNPAAERMHGKKVLGIGPPDYTKTYHLLTPDREPYPSEKLPLTRAVHGHTTEDERWLIRRGDGSEILAIGSAHPLVLDGERVGAVLTFRDDTARHSAELALRESEARLRAIIAATPDCVKVVASDGALAEMNPAGLNMIESETFDQVAGADVFDIIAPEHRGDWMKRHRQVCGGESHSWEFDIIGLAGTRRRMETHAVPLPLPDGSVGQLAVTRDVSKRRAAEEALRRSEERFRAVFESAGVGMVEIDDEWRILGANPAYSEIIGYPLDELIGTSCLDLIHPDDIEGAKKERRDLVTGEKNRVSFEKRYVRSDGSFVWVRSNLARLGKDGSRFLKIVEDISDAKAAEAALQQRSEEFYTLADNIPLLAWMAYADGHIFWYNRRWYEYTGTAPEDQEGWGWESVHHPDTLPQVVARWTASIESEQPFEMTFPLLGADGKYRSFLTRVVPIRDDSGEILRWFGTNVDVSEQVRAEQMLREESHTLETLNRVGSSLSGELDLERVVQMVTDAGVELTGAQFGAFFYNTTDERGESYMLFTLSGAERSQFERFGMPRKTDIFAPTFDAEGIVRSDDITKDPRYGKNAPNAGMPEGHLPVTSYLAVPVVDRDGQAIGGLFFGHPETAQFTERHERLMEGIAAQAAIAIDNARLFRAAQHQIAERMKVEQALTALNETLETRVIEEIERRSQAEEALRQSQKMETVGQLSGGIAHDFNNLLQVIHGNLSMLQRALPAEQPRLHRAIANALTGADRAASLTQRLLAFSRRQPLNPQPVNINRMIEGMADLLHRTLGETVEVEARLGSPMRNARVDENQLENAILNLAINARDAMRDGGRLVIETGIAEVQEGSDQLAGAAEPGCYVRVAVADTGTGMSEEVLSRAVEPFFTTKEVGQGTGLGLSMVYGFVNQSGGFLSLKSKQGQGTTIELFLPCSADPERQREAAQPSAAPHGSGETILLCEDDDDVRQFSNEALSDLGYRVIEAQDADSALQRLRAEGEVDLLFTDVVLPGGKTGADLARSAREIQPGLKVLYTTGYARSALDDSQARLELISKPFSIEDLARRVRQLLDSD